MRLPASEEQELCAQAKAGDREALGRLLRTYGPVLYRSVLLPRLGSAARAEDALGDTYSRVVEKFGSFEWQGCGVYPWLRVIALRIALDHLRSRRRELLFSPDDLAKDLEQADAQGPRAPDVEVLEAQDLEAGRAKLTSALAKVNPRYAQAIRLRILEERPREEAARELGVTPATFDVVLHRALSALRKALGHEAPEKVEVES